MDSIVELYCAILDFQVRGFLHLHHHFVRRLASDTFNKDQWSRRVDKIHERVEKLNECLDDQTRQIVEGRLSVILDRQETHQQVVLAQFEKMEVRQGGTPEARRLVSGLSSIWICHQR